MPPVPPSYEERPPPSALAPLVACLWVQRGADGFVQRVVPDGCVDLLWIANGSDVRVEVAGPDTWAHFERMSAGTSITGVRFRPGAASGVLGPPLHALRDERVPLAELWGRAAVERMTDEVLASARPGLTAATAVFAALPHAPDASGPALAEALANRSGPGTVRGMAEELGMSERQLHRRCLSTFGYGPKTVQRILRFQAALEAARQGDRLADVAATVGYADQAHMARDVRALAGVPLTELLGS